SGRGDRVRVVREAPSAAPHVAARQHARDRDLPAGRLPEARGGVEERLRARLRVARRVLATLRRERIARSAQLSQDEFEGPRESLPLALSGRGARRREAGQLSRGARVVSRVPCLVPAGFRVAVDQLSGRRPAAREQGLRGGRGGIRAHGLRLCAARALVRGGLRGDLRSPRVSQRGGRRGDVRGTARDGHELAEVRGRVPRARARAGRSRRGRAGRLRDEGFSARKLVDRYPSSEVALRRPAWTIVAHSSFELADFPAAEAAYAHVLELTPE